MSRAERLSLGSAVSFLAAGCLLIELLGFRLLVGLLGAEMDLVFGIGLGAVLALGACVLGPRNAKASIAELRARAAHLAGLTATSWMAALITLTWVSQKVARSVDDAHLWRLAVMAAFWMATSFFAGGALATVYRTTRIGRIGWLTWLEAAGGAGGLLVAGFVLQVGAPRAALLVAGLVTVAALLFGLAARQSRPSAAPVNWALLATAALAVVALLVGDLWVPWLKYRTHNGHRSKVTARSWSVGGLVSVHRSSRRSLKVSTDRGAAVHLGQTAKKNKRPSFQAADLIYYVDPPPAGRALVIGSAGGHEVASALAHGHEQIDVVVADRTVASGVWLGHGHDKTKGLFDDPRRVRISVGDGRSLVAGTPPGTYQRIVVVRSEQFAADPLRVLPTTVGRRYTSAAIQNYLRVLDDHGVLLLKVPGPAVPAVLAAARATLGGRASLLRKRSFVCSKRKGGDAILLLRASDFDAKMRHKLKSRCRRGRLDVDYPIEVVRQGNRDYEMKKADRDAKMSRAETGVAVSADRPFFKASRAASMDDVRMTLAALSPDVLLRRGRRPPRDSSSKKKASLEGKKSKVADKKKASLKGKKSKVADKKKASLKGKKSKVADKKPKVADKKKASPTRKALNIEKNKAKAPVRRGRPSGQPPPKPVVAAEPKVMRFALALVTAAFVFFVAFVVWLLPYRTEEGAERVPRALRWSLPCFGAALALGSMLVLDALIEELGTMSATYTLLIPAMLAGAAGSRLLVDVRHVGWRSVDGSVANDPDVPVVPVRGVLLTGVVSMGSVLPFAFGDPLVATVIHAVPGLELVSAGIIALLVGAAVGYPMAAGLRAVGASSSVAAAASWGAHRAGWVVGVAGAAVLARSVGVSALGLLASAVMSLGMVLFLVGARQLSESSTALQ